MDCGADTKPFETEATGKSEKISEGIGDRNRTNSRDLAPAHPPNSRRLNVTPLTAVVRRNLVIPRFHSEQNRSKLGRFRIRKEIAMLSRAPAL